MAVSKKAWLGVAREATSGTPIATPTMLLPTKAGFKNNKRWVYLDEERGTRDGNNGRVLTVQHATGTFKGKWYNDSCPYLLLGFMGTDTPTNPVAGVTSHALSLADIPPSLTLFRALDSAATYQLPYSVINKIKLSWDADGKLLEMDGGFMSQYTGAKMVAPPTRPADTSVLPFGGYVPTIGIGGTTSLDVDQMDLELEQKITLWFNSAGGRTFATAYFGERTAKLGFEARFDNDTLWEHYEQGLDDLVTVSFSGPQLIVNQQTVAIPGGTTAGNFTLTYKGQTTANIAFNATNAAVASALQALSTIGASGCTVTGGPGPSTAWVVNFTGALASDQTLLTGTGTGLTPSGAVTVTPVVYPELLSFNFPIVGWDEADHDTGKDNIKFKAKGTARPGTAINSLFTATVQNAVTSYAV